MTGPFFSLNGVLTSVAAATVPLDDRENYKHGGTALAGAPADQVLEGVTQMTVCQVIRDLGIALEERPLPLSDLSLWQGAFLTSTSTKIMPLRQIDDTVVPLPPLVDRLRFAYDDWLDAYARSRV